MINRVGGAGEGFKAEECVDDGFERHVECDNGHFWISKHHCWDRACPRCSRAWAVRGSKRSAARVEGLAALFAYLPRHVIFSPPPGAFTEDMPLAEIRRAFTRAAIASGLHGGCLVVHGWREKNRGEGDWYWSPHAHFIAWGRIASRPVGWVVKVIRQVSHRGDAEATIAYELDHAAYEGAGAALTWYGSTSNARICVKYAREMRASECVICGAPEHEQRLDEESGEMVDFLHLEPYFTAKCTLRARKPPFKPRKRSKWASLRSPTRARA